MLWRVIPSETRLFEYKRLHLQECLRPVKACFMPTRTQYLQIPGPLSLEPRRATEETVIQNAWVDPAESILLLIDFGD